MGGALGSPFLSYDESLLCDRAILANVPHGRHIKPFTTTETMEAGWCWNTSSVEDDHRGYVFRGASSAMTTLPKKCAQRIPACVSTA